VSAGPDGRYHVLALSPRGHLLLEETDSLVGVSGAFTATDSLVLAFAASQGAGLLALGALRRSTPAVPPEVVFWGAFANVLLETLAHTPEAADNRLPEHLAPPPGEFSSRVLQIPVMRGAEYATAEVFENLWLAAFDHVCLEASATEGGLRAWLGRVNPALGLLGKVTFHLAENKRSTDLPFAFLATYTHRLTEGGKAAHLPLARALQEYVGAQNQSALNRLLDPVQKAADQSPWARAQLESRRIFQAQAWAPADALAFLRETPLLESSGVILRIPDWWRDRSAPRPKVRLEVGEQRKGGVGLEALLSFNVKLSLGETELTPAEMQTLLRGSGGLVSLRGQWVEVDRDKLEDVLEHWKNAERAVSEGIPFYKAMRLLSGATLGDEKGDLLAAEKATPDWTEVVAGGWLREALERLRSPGQGVPASPIRGLQAKLRPYQAEGVHWLWFMQSLGLGACLADDMGLGKTIQVIALLQRLKNEEGAAAPRPPSATDAPALIVAPASLLANWRNELNRFTPKLRLGVAHPSDPNSGAWRDSATADMYLKGKDVVLTTYGQVSRLTWLTEKTWRLLVLDEAQAIKNSGARQTRAVKELKAVTRIALSGTPVENRLGDLWSLFDFLNPGLLGGPAEFTSYAKRLTAASREGYAPLRRLVRPYLLRRLKTDRTIIADLPDKTETTAWCPLSKEQAALYQQGVRDLEKALAAQADGIQRRGLVLAALMRFKQICNHPGHWRGDDAYDPAASGKFSRLAELAEEIASRQEKLLVFSQFKEMTEPLVDFLRGVFRREGLLLHGGTSIGERQQLVDAFQREDGPPFFVLSLKAGGTGLNLTAANHVVHFDRWWNPAVENQATDRAFRIGQKRNVMVHKFVCRGTIEERIDALMCEKQTMADAVLGAEGGAEKLLTEMSNDELIRFVSLDLNSALAE
jgi:superfamily II DNA or RNA helicase